MSLGLPAILEIAFFTWISGSELDFKNMRTRPLIAITLLALSLAACHKAPAEAPPEIKTEHRSDFTPEEFGIGRAHTRNTRCNREIDQLLEQIRECVNENSAVNCDTQQQDNNNRIARLENSLRCQR